RNIWIIARREYDQYFASPVAYMIMFVIYLVIGIFFYLNMSFAFVQTQYAPTVQIILAPLATMLVLAVPAITTRLLAEERRLGTIELLLTAPVRDWELVIGKWLGAFLLVVTILGFSLIYPILLNNLVDPGIDQGMLLTGYLGLFLLAAVFTAVGVFVSSLFSNQIAAFATTMGALIFLWWVINPIAQVLGQTSPVGRFFSFIDISDHFFNNFLSGVVDLTQLVYALSLTALALFGASMVLEVRRWR
ncbi:MAG TPA: ABC transporter permease, partial [Anaerolineales bacterium]|nr:ABC transporter permease [Anaerolineales bacterium]